jgi:opacity protein-like surface antigen
VRAAALTALALAPACASLPPLSPFATENTRPVRSLDLSFGAREYVEQDDWPEIEEQPAVSLQLWWHRSSEALAWELGLHYAEEDQDLPAPGGTIEGRMGELSAGLRYQLEPGGVFHPYLAGGLSGLYAWQELEPFGFGFPPTDDDEWAFGVYAHGGLRAELYEDVFLGLDLRFLAEDWISGGDYDLDYGQLAVSVGSLF